MSDEEIKEGEVVVLKSGGPNMTVTAVGDNYGVLTAWCAWFDGKKPCNEIFPVTSLQKT
jgi:uncharacterized protein YodC (DUF2158 family)